MRADQLAKGQIIRHSNGHEYEVFNATEGMYANIWLALKPYGDDPDYAWEAWNLPPDYEVEVL